MYLANIDVRFSRSRVYMFNIDMFIWLLKNITAIIVFLL